MDPGAVVGSQDPPAPMANPPLYKIIVYPFALSYTYYDSFEIMR